MSTSAKLVTLFLGLGIVFWAPVATADCPHGVRFDHPHCDGGDPPPMDLGPPLLVDADLEVVGIITALRPGGVELLLRLGSGPVVIRAKPGFLLGVDGNPRFESANCTGPAFAPFTAGSDLLGFMPPAYIGPPGFTLYVQTDTAPVGDKFILSVWFEGGCVPFVENSPDFRAIFPVQELFFTPPFEVE